MAASGTVTVKVERALVSPRYPVPLVRHAAALRVEVSLGRHVLYVYHNHKIVLISHISSGGGYYYCSSGGCSYAITPTGNFRTTWRVNGWHTSPLGQMYNPVFFYSGFAIHGDTYVPVQPVSHGCVRVPMDVASIFPGLVPRNGIPVYVRAAGLTSTALGARTDRRRSRWPSHRQRLRGVPARQPEWPSARAPVRPEPPVQPEFPSSRSSRQPEWPVGGAAGVAGVWGRRRGLAPFPEDVFVRVRDAPPHRLQDGQALADQPGRDLAETVRAVQHADVGAGQPGRRLLDDLRQLADQHLVQRDPVVRGRRLGLNPGPLGVGHREDPDPLGLGLRGLDHLGDQLLLPQLGLPLRPVRPARK